MGQNRRSWLKCGLSSHHKLPRLCLVLSQSCPGSTGSCVPFVFCPVLCFCSYCLLPWLALCVLVYFLSSMCFRFMCLCFIAPLSLLPDVSRCSLPTCVFKPLCFPSSLSVNVHVRVRVLAGLMACSCSFPFIVSKDSSLLSSPSKCCAFGSSH